jgi:hypothetical protein
MAKKYMARFACGAAKFEFNALSSRFYVKLPLQGVEDAGCDGRA